MKRSRVFLGITTACLAIAGALAARVTHFNEQPSYYKTVAIGVNHPFCLQAPRPLAAYIYDNLGAQTGTTVLIIPGLGNVRYKLYTGATCLHAFTYTSFE